MSVFTSPCHLQSDLHHLHPPRRAAVHLPADPRTRPQRGASLALGWRCSPPSWRSCWGWSWHWLTEKNPASTGETQTLHLHVLKRDARMSTKLDPKTLFKAFELDSAQKTRPGFTAFLLKLARPLMMYTWLLCYLQVSSCRRNVEMWFERKTPHLELLI